MKKIVLYWENFGPMHDDRAREVAATFPDRAVLGIQRTSRSGVYAWDSTESAGFEKVTLFPDSDEQSLPNAIRQAIALTRACLAAGDADIFLCNYNETHVLLSACALRLMGRRVYTMGVSKFDDYKRNVFREFLKGFYLKPYVAGLSSGIRAKEYLEFLGVRKVVGEYNTLSIERIRSASGSVPAPDGAPFSERGFVAVARLVPKKNLAMLIDAYARYRASVAIARPLTICGNGPLESDLKNLAASLGVDEHITFTGFVQSDEISRILANGIALLLPSIEEQFGNVVIEAQALGLPVILSDNCGARDTLVRSAVNGFVVEPDNPAGLAWFMTTLAENESLWRSMCQAALDGAHKGDVRAFANGIGALVR